MEPVAHVERSRIFLLKLRQGTNAVWRSRGTLTAIQLSFVLVHLKMTGVESRNPLLSIA